MTYWLDLFTGQTWQEFRDYGATVSGFRKRMRNAVNRIKPGDVLLCYLTGVMRWVGALEVRGRSQDKKMIWQFDEFPERLSVKPVVLLRPEHGVPMEELEGKVDFYRSRADRPGFNGFLRMSPNRFKRPSDGELILNLLRVAATEPVARPVDPKKLARKPFYKAESKRGKRTVTTIVSVPDPDEGTRAEPTAEPDKDTATTRHTEIQYALLSLGRDMGFNLWVARNDRSKVWDGTTLGSIPGMVDKLPTQFNEATNRTIELIDVLWLKGNSIVAAFEVESTTSIYSGLLRMSDLLALQPNLSIDLFLVAPDDRRDKVESELMRPTFKLREKPLASICGFLGFDSLTDKLKAIQKLGLASSLKPDFLQKTAEYFSDDDAR